MLATMRVELAVFFRTVCRLVERGYAVEGSSSTTSCPFPVFLLPPACFPSFQAAVSKAISACDSSLLSSHSKNSVLSTIPASKLMSGVASHESTQKV